MAQLPTLGGSRTSHHMKQYKITPKTWRIIRFSSWIIGIVTAVLARQLCLLLGMRKQNVGVITIIVFMGVTVLIVVATHCCPVFQATAARPDGTPYTKKDKVVAAAILILAVPLLGFFYWLADAIANE